MKTGGPAEKAAGKKVGAGELRAGNTEGYRNYGVNGFISTEQDRRSTFAIDLDTASYTIARRKLLEGPPPGTSSGPSSSRYSSVLARSCGRWRPGEHQGARHLPKYLKANPPFMASHTQSG